MTTLILEVFGAGLILFLFGPTSLFTRGNVIIIVSVVINISLSQKGKAHENWSPSYARYSRRIIPSTTKLIGVLKL